MKRVFVFIGPSTPHGARDRFAKFDFQPPVRRGDLLRLLHKNPSVFAIVDGYFSEKPSVLHKEILEAISENVTVIGAASMGALRAAELSPFGMIGIGRVFERYKWGELTGDDEVALLHGPSEMGYRPLTFAVVNLRATLDAAVNRGRIDRVTAAEVVRLSRELTLGERRLDVLLSRIANSNLADQEKRAAIAILNGKWIDQKQIDAELLLNELHSGNYEEPAAIARDVRNSVRLRTCWLDLHALNYGHSGITHVSDNDLWVVAKLLVPGYSDLHLEVVRTVWLSQQYEGARNGGQSVDRSVAEPLGDDISAKLLTLGIRRSEFLEWTRAERQAQAMQTENPSCTFNHWTSLRDPFGRLPGRFFVVRLKLSALYQRTAALAGKVCEINKLFERRNAGFAASRIDGAFLIEKFMAESDVSASQLEAYSNSRGFENLDELVYALQLTYLYRTIQLHKRIIVNDQSKQWANNVRTDSF